MSNSALLELVGHSGGWRRRWSLRGAPDVAEVVGRISEISSDRGFSLRRGRSKITIATTIVVIHLSPGLRAQVGSRRVPPAPSSAAAARGGEALGGIAVEVV